MTIPLPFILYHDAKDGDRKISNINRNGFYQSTGTSSGYQGTWFPFLGLGDKTSNTSFYKRDAIVSGTGHLIKPNIAYRDIPADIEEKGKEFGLEENFFYRMGNTECLLISSLTNEGYWATENGKNFKEYLQGKFEEFYTNNPDIHFPGDPVQTVNSSEPGLVNNWLKENGPLKPIQGVDRVITSEDKKKQFAMRKSPPKQGGVLAGMRNLEQQENIPQVQNVVEHSPKEKAPHLAKAPPLQRYNATRELPKESPDARSHSAPTSPTLQRQEHRHNILFDNATHQIPKEDIHPKSAPLERKAAHKNLKEEKDESAPSAHNKLKK